MWTKHVDTWNFYLLNRPVPPLLPEAVITKNVHFHREGHGRQVCTMSLEQLTFWASSLALRVDWAKFLRCANYIATEIKNGRLIFFFEATPKPHPFSIIPFITSGRHANESCTASIIMLLCLHSLGLSRYLPATLITTLSGEEWGKKVTPA